ncbi:hypothetical protein SUGI_0499390 [Cryptomeria japonica]|nr:hypothetical protein SUGI_0499390 [Cryptomeria japonica]
MNEVNIGMSLTPGNSELLRSKLTPAAYHEALLTGRRFNVMEAKEAGLVHAWHANPIEALHSGLNKAVDYASRKWNKNVYQALKMEIFKKVVWEMEQGGLGFARM